MPEYDKNPYQVNLSGQKLVLTSEVSEKLHYRISKEFSADATGNAIVVKYGISNEGKEAQRVAPWEITRVPNDGLIFFDASVDDITPDNLMSFKNAHGAAWYEADTTEENRKINADGKGWLAYCNNGLLLIKDFQDLDASEPAPGEAEIQVYVNRGKTYIELESQGAYTLLQPGESLHWTVKWYLQPCLMDAMPSAELVSQVRRCRFAR